MTSIDYYPYLIKVICTCPGYYGNRGDQIDVADVCTAHNTHKKGCGLKNWTLRNVKISGNSVGITYRCIMNVWYTLVGLIST